MLEIVRGTVIGNITISWQLFHNGNCVQHFTTAKNEYEAKQAAEKRKNELIKIDPVIYREKDIWEVKYYN
ncbi:MAG: hypothetical protein WCX96_04730 [Bacilli bacterium]